MCLYRWCSGLSSYFCALPYLRWHWNPIICSPDPANWKCQLELPKLNEVQWSSKHTQKKSNVRVPLVNPSWIKYANCGKLIINPPINKVRQPMLKGKSTSELIYLFSTRQFMWESYIFVFNLAICSAPHRSGKFSRDPGHCLENFPRTPAIVWPKLYLDALNVLGWY